MASKKSTSAEPAFGMTSVELAIAELATAEADAKNINAEASVVRAKKSSAAVGVITTAHASGYDERSLRSSLLNAGVPKGTASKIITVLRAVAEGKVSLTEGSSLSGLYALATKSESVEAVETSPAGPSIVEKIVEVKVEYATVEDMADDLIARFILGSDDPFTVSGKVLRMLTDKISTAVAPFAHSED